MNLPCRKTTLQDALQEVPQLLESCASNWFDGGHAQDLGHRSGVRVFRLVCKHISKISLQAVHGYHLTVSVNPSKTEPVLDVVGFLKNSHLKHLHVDVLAPDGERNISGLVVLEVPLLSWQQSTHCEHAWLVKQI